MSKKVTPRSTAACRSAVISFLSFAVPRALTALSPLQYQKQLRLQTARQRMLMDGIDASSAAYEVGYESISQFSREYSRFFGLPPMRDVKALRAATPPQQREQTTLCGLLCELDAMFGDATLLPNNPILAASCGEETRLKDVTRMQRSHSNAKRSASFSAYENI